MSRKSHKSHKSHNSRKKSRDLRWFTIHSWIGLKLSILMSFVLFTGTMAVLSSEIDWLLNPPMRAATPVHATAWGEALTALRAEYPEAKILSVSRRADAWWAIEALVESPWGELGRLWFDPATGEYQGYTSWLNVQRFFRTVHRHLMLPTKIGIPIVTALAVPLLVSLIAGLVVYKGFWRGFFRWPRFERTTRIWAGDLHRLLGLWSSWFLVLIALTSVWYLVEVMGGRAPSLPSPTLPVGEWSEPSGEGLQAMVAEAERVHPDFQIRRIVFPNRDERPLLLMGELDAVLVRPRANAVAFASATGELVGHYRGEELDLHTRISEAADPLHFGYFGGLWTKALWFLLGAAMTSLSITGCVIYGKRLAKRPRRPATQEAAMVIGKGAP
ncbi:MAG: PepSY-associated TM helix domain-containing protein [Pseudomonadota bacterium]